MSDVFRALKTALAYGTFESSDIAGATFKLIDCLEGDIISKYEATDKTEETIAELTDAIDAYNEESIAAEEELDSALDSEDTEDDDDSDDDIDDSLDQEEDEVELEPEEDPDAYKDDDDES